MTPLSIPCFAYSPPHLHPPPLSISSWYIFCPPSSSYHHLSCNRTRFASMGRYKPRQIRQIKTQRNRQKFPRPLWPQTRKQSKALIQTKLPLPPTPGHFYCYSHRLCGTYLCCPPLTPAKYNTHVAPTSPPSPDLTCPIMIDTPPTHPPPSCFHSPFLPPLVVAEKKSAAFTFSCSLINMIWSLCSPLLWYLCTAFHTPPHSAPLF